MTKNNFQKSHTIVTSLQSPSHVASDRKLGKALEQG